jgi:hypothetical protein
MHPPSQAHEPSALPESSWVPPESSPWTPESETPLEDVLLEDPLLEELPLEEPPLDIARPEPSPPPEAPSVAAPSLDSMGFEAPGDPVPQAGTRGIATSAKPQMRTDRAFILGGQAIPMPCSRVPEMPGRSASKRTVGWTLPYDGRPRPGCSPHPRSGWGRIHSRPAIGLLQLGCRTVSDG